MSRSFAISTKEAENMIEDLMMRESELTSWEHTFVQGLSDQMSVNRHLSLRQLQILKNTWEKICGDN